MNHIAQIASKLPEYGLDAMLITSQSGERYALGFHGEGLLLVTREGGHYTTDGRYIEAAQEQVTEVELSLDALQQEAETLEEEYTRQQAEQLSAGIEEELASYIWDKAQALGLNCQVSVTVETGADGVPAPRSVDITGEYSEALSEIIEKDLGVPREQQNWQEAS